MPSSSQRCSCWKPLAYHRDVYRGFGTPVTRSMAWLPSVPSLTQPKSFAATRSDRYLPVQYPRVEMNSAPRHDGAQGFPFSHAGGFVFAMLSEHDAEKTENAQESSSREMVLLRRRHNKVRIRERRARRTKKDRQPSPPSSAQLSSETQNATDTAAASDRCSCLQRA